MGLILKQLNKGNEIVSDGKGGTLTVLNGKGKLATTKAWKDEGTIKKGDDIHGIEFVLELKNAGNVIAQTYDKDTKKFIPSLTPVPDIFKATLFLSGLNGDAYKKVLPDLELSKKLGLLPADHPVDGKLLIDGFSGKLTVGENDQMTQLMADDFTKAGHFKITIFEEFELKDCSFDFAAPSAGYKGGGSAQSEKDKLSDRVNFVQGVLTDASTEQQLFVKLLAIDGTITHKEFISLMFQ
jgi:hypothetical protein